MLRLLILTLFLCPIWVYSQKKPTYLSFELGGNGLIASANVAKTLYVNVRFKVIFQTGLGWTSSNSDSLLPFNIPSQLTCNFGNKNFYFESGLGSTFVLKSRLHVSNEDRNVNKTNNEFYLSPLIGVRYEFINWYVRIYTSPLFLITDEHLYDDLTLNSFKIGIGIGGIF